MKNVKKRLVMLMTAMVLCLAMGMPSVMTAKAAECELMSGEVWVHEKCGTPVVVSTKQEFRVDNDTKVKCVGNQHSPYCWICTMYYWNVYTITCPECNITIDQNKSKEWEKHNVHVDIY